jgi:uncharacterized protein YndB with AHSA1/START domain
MHFQFPHPKPTSNNLHIALVSRRLFTGRSKKWTREKSSFQENTHRTPEANESRAGRSELRGRLSVEIGTKRPAAATNASYRSNMIGSRPAEFLPERRAYQADVFERIRTSQYTPIRLVFRASFRGNYPSSFDIPCSTFFGSRGVSQGGRATKQSRYFFTLGSDMTESSQPIIVEQDFDVSRETVWKAITDHEQMINWFFDNIPEFEAEVGFETQFNVSTGERDFHHLWKITEVIPEQKIVYDWRYQDLPGAGKVTFEIFEEGDGSRLRVTNEGLESFPRDIPEFTRESCEGGWKYFIQGNLKKYVETRK